MVETIYWGDDCVKLLDQTILPHEERYLTLGSHEDVAKAIEEMCIRGAPAIGIAAAMGIALGAMSVNGDDAASFRAAMEPIFARFQQTRPTAVNLQWAINQMRRVLQDTEDLPQEAIVSALIEKAKALRDDDIRINQNIGLAGREILGDGDTVLTHCNAGALATAGFGTALGVIRAAHAEGKKIDVLAGETRPRFQGAKLTCWELSRESIPVTLITDNMAGYFLSRGRINKVITGADRIAANGDAANKIGTYTLAVLARENGVPFYVAAPLSTVDLSIESGEAIVIEERDQSEVSQIEGQRICPPGVRVANPAFDVTPHTYITGIITEAGIVTDNFSDNFRRLKEETLV